MFSIGKSKVNNVTLINPKWNKGGSKTINFTGYRIVESSPYYQVFFHECTAHECKEWVKKTETEGEYKDVLVKEQKIVQLNLLTKEIEQYGKKITPTKWETFLIEMLTQKQKLKSKGQEYAGFIDCSQEKDPLLTLYLKENNTETKELFLSQILSFVPLEGLDYDDIFASVINSSNTSSPRKTKIEISREVLDYVSKELSRYLVKNEELDLAQCIDLIYKVESSVELQKHLLYLDVLMKSIV